VQAMGLNSRMELTMSVGGVPMGKKINGKHQINRVL
jgi:hypothetical protein